AFHEVNSTPSSPQRKKRRHTTQPSSSPEETLPVKKSQTRIRSAVTVPPAGQVTRRPSPLPEQSLQDDWIPTTPPRAITPDYSHARRSPPTATEQPEPPVTWSLVRLTLQPPRFSRPRHPPLGPLDPRNTRPISPRSDIVTADKWTQTGSYTSSRRLKQRDSRNQRAPLTDSNKFF
ncbi:PREDICTED: putative uncharacterized protein ENSP00000383309, partial [Vollenhovia emeryi]|uniref:putative uncharacterized protein ENSP00000383309 n=1 Tax=Vollenhovia emeryi TaxID=411798 RepID=UPI0005F4614A